MSTPVRSMRRTNWTKVCAPWCIADGSAHARFEASFTDEDGVGDYGAPVAVPPEVVATVCYRTPGFSGWQQERWWTHCGDAAAYIGTAGAAGIEALGESTMECIRHDTGLEGEAWTRFLASLSKDGSPTAYLFRCRHCGTVGGYQDSH